MPKSARIAVAMACADWRRAVPRAAVLCRRAARAALTAGVPSSCVEASILLADDATVRQLNDRYRHRDMPTNVLSFPQQDGEAAAPVSEDGNILLGDVVVAFETVCAEAAHEGKTVADHLCHMIVHGILHLLGYDHQNNAEAERMEHLEIEALASLGIGSPYADRPIGHHGAS